MVSKKGENIKKENNGNLIPIVVITYNRLKHTKITLESLASNKGFTNHPVIIFSDGPRPKDGESVSILREYLEDFKRKHSNVSIVKRSKNLGLAKSIISSINEIFETYESAIIVEDDIRTSPEFLNFMVLMLNKYKDKKEIGSVSGYNPPTNLMKIPKGYLYDIYFIPRTSSWGWATWKDRWDGVDWKVTDFEDFINNKKQQKLFNRAGEDMTDMLKKQVINNIDTWDIQWAYHNFKMDRLTIYPCNSYVENVGHDGTGIHCGTADSFKNENLNTAKVSAIPSKIAIDERMLKEFRKPYSLNLNTLPLYMQLVRNKLKKMLKDRLVSTRDR